jgi:hypothetical protein
MQIDVTILPTIDLLPISRPALEILVKPQSGRVQHLSNRPSLTKIGMRIQLTVLKSDIPRIPANPSL